MGSGSMVEKGSLEEPNDAITKTVSSGVGEVDLDSSQQLERGLKSRHIQFLALGGAIGTGLFVGSGVILSTVGPAPLFMGYCTMMFVVWVVMNNLAEIVTYLPMRGISLPYFVGRFVDPSLAFADGWNYWYAYAILVAAEVTAGAIVLQYWTTAVPVAVWIAIILVVILLLNIIAVDVFGEAEFWFASIKLISITGLIILSIVLFFGGGPDQGRIGFRYWEPNNPGAFNPYLVDGSTGRFLAYWTAFVRAGFAFITSPELIALAAGETVAPRRNIPKAAERYVWRLAIFYGLGSLSIGVIVPFNDSQLLSGESNASASPFVIGIQRAGIPVLNHIINAAILTSAWSAGNAFLYSGSRVLYSMALNKQAPKFFSSTTKKGVPWAAVMATWLFGCLGFLNVSNSGAQVFNWFSNISTISGYIAWIVVMITYLRFRKAMSFNGMMNVLPFRTPLQPYATQFTLFLITVLTLTNGFQVFFPGNWSASNFLAAYITIPIFFGLYFGHKIWMSTYHVMKERSWDGHFQAGPMAKAWVGHFMKFGHKVQDIDCLTGKREMDELEAMDVPPVAKNWLEKFWFWLA
ncbi:amino acid permease [Hortaea werneckii]|uniref:Amino acid permease/ SLC12A domain-containing protein n=1 Tax=Hortaea werneckii TaxID=91943 RepID=A0A3M7FD28_HORWE|nr:amino acid permease [Hortaea werneckii]KAI7001429.1 amino acid permease [Hortaea werneckii]KAI7148880.1 amino acid permease [Hortaea werneckii]KAI7178640.1 amino acid permease [Hortaea werneckii]KAI7193135.1 amino acid permease [Hortaea werneckii]